ncbi:family 16 glycosylhydrolase [Paenibacillus pini]|uniref:Beta-glucanase n=1 Tax=Paenibacillus pini JCM 16418 TaxID=1236976 RepID=W7YL57_9BACL|nr:family 16 glycosylhydrolase [Paenibacillus pini]GAF08478.1 beta-glucanase precursor [Paenibacillus pini JCM 16418]
MFLQSVKNVLRVSTLVLFVSAVAPSVNAHAAAWSQQIEAESGVKTGTVKEETVIGNSGKTVSFIDQGEANSLTIKVTPVQGSTFDMNIRYRSGEQRNLMYSVNNKAPQKISSLNSGSWSSFDNETLPIELTPGQENTVKFFAPAGENGPGLDYVTFQETTVSPIDKSGYRLIFQEEFGDKQLNQGKWVNKYLSSWTKTPQYAQPTYVMENGLMKLQIKQDTQPWAPEFDGQTVVSGFTTGNRNALHNWNGNNTVRNPVETELTHINQYGYYEIRAMGQPGSSRHVAWWLLGFEDIPNESAEIDIFEILGNNSHSVPVAFHRWNDPTGPEGGGFAYTNNNMDFHKEFHTYGFNWVQGGGSASQPDKMEFYVDGVKTGEKNVKIDYPLIQLFSLYEKRAGGWTGPWVSKPYPNTFRLDYVRVYKKIPAGYATVPQAQLAITNVANASLSISPNAKPKTYVSAVPGQEGQTFTESTLPGTKSYTNVTYNDGVVTQEFVKWDPITAQDLEKLQRGETVTKQGTLPNIAANFPGLVRPVLTINTTPWDTNLNSNNLNLLFDQDGVSTSSSWTSIMNRCQLEPIFPIILDNQEMCPRFLLQQTMEMDKVSERLRCLHGIMPLRAGSSRGQSIRFLGRVQEIEKRERRLQ